MTTVPEEAALLLRINQTLPAKEQQRFDALVAKRRQDTITPEELQELLQLTDQSERNDADRLVALDTLARFRGVTLRALMDMLGIKPPPY